MRNGLLQTNCECKKPWGYSGYVYSVTHKTLSLSTGQEPIAVDGPAMKIPSKDNLQRSQTTYLRWIPASLIAESAHQVVNPLVNYRWMYRLVCINPMSNYTGWQIPATALFPPSKQIQQLFKYKWCPAINDKQNYGSWWKVCGHPCCWSRFESAAPETAGFLFKAQKSKNLVTRARFKPQPFFGVALLRRSSKVNRDDLSDKLVH